MQHSGKLTVSTPTDREIVMKREFAAPRALVWDALTRPDLIRRWLFNPPGWQMTACEEDQRVGGAFRWAWNGPDGNQAMVLRGVYQDVQPGVRLTRTETFDMGCISPGAEQVSTIELKELGPTRTQVTITVVYPNREARDAMLASGMEMGVGLGYDQLEALLAQTR